MNDNKEKKKINILKGTVVSSKMNKTLVAKTVRTFMHPRFHKIMRSAKKYKVHDEHQEAKVGDMVEFYEGRPKSKTKYMYLKRIIKSNE